MLVFVHGAGRSGAAAWPTIERADAVMLDLASIGSVRRKAEAVAAAVEEAAVIVAHSHGAIPALLALPLVGQRLRALVLCEPALYDVARGEPAIESHIATMEAARRAHENGLRAYWQIVRPLMFGGKFDEERWPDEERVAARFSTVPPPWGLGIAASDIAGTSTIVVTGGWNDEYEAIAAALVAEGAEHQVLTGARHRPQDAPGFDAVLAEALSR
ncbi:alpha/beta fold hydrolase [Antribacter sp. KLBMP9083]|uniref:Alpha/beta fold hydrolase n=1 Tax=Antribacter soli TaxID=2910976 RepID=A0AA41QFH5_9MICO|nr:alpha/beta fold hydrolase [Antribacter soli]MCF4121701.1 alpha/beta fold hydrolase [Antribacter soli]